MPTENSTQDKSEKTNVLVVDDESAIVALMEETLTTEHLSVTGFSDSQLALSHFKDNINKYSLVITDQTMPNLTGVELAKEISQLQPDIAIILCSGYSEHVNKNNLEGTGITTYMSKPVNMNELEEMVNKHI